MSRTDEVWATLQREREKHLRTKRRLAEARRRIRAALAKGDEVGPWSSAARAIISILHTPTKKAPRT